MDTILETLAEVTAMIPRYSWEIMDEGQRDELMEKIILPRYMQTTADGVKLGPTVWAEMVGATAESIRKRVGRLQESQKVDDGERTGRSETEKRSLRAASRFLRESTPEEITVLMINEPEVRSKFSQALVQAADPEPGGAGVRTAQRTYEPSRGPTTREMRRQRLLRLKQALIQAEASLTIALELLAATTPDFHEREELAGYVENIATMIGDIVSRAEGDWDAALSKILEEE